MGPFNCFLSGYYTADYVPVWADIVYVGDLGQPFGAESTYLSIWKKLNDELIDLLVFYGLLTRSCGQ